MAGPDGLRRPGRSLFLVVFAILVLITGGATLLRFVKMRSRRTEALERVQALRVERDALYAESIRLMGLASPTRGWPSDLYSELRRASDELWSAHHQLDSITDEIERGEPDEDIAARERFIQSLLSEAEDRIVIAQSELSDG